MIDLDVARKYCAKAQHAKDSNKEFSLSLVSFRNMMRAKRCFFTGLPLSADVITVDRVNNQLGYVKGNVVACHRDANQLKSIIENPINSLTIKNVKRLLDKWDEKI